MNRPSSLPTHVLLAGGGSGGHIFPALAVGEELLARGAAVSFAGSPTGMEAELVPARGVAFHPLAARAFVGRGAAAKLGALVTLGGSSLRARSLVRRIGVDLTLGTGGYASLPAALGTWLSRRPLVVLEPNADAGSANRVAARFAAGACVGVGARPRLACALWETGVPVRTSFGGGATPLPAGSVRVLVLGGSSGSADLNRAVPAAIALADPDGLVAVRHQSGRNHGAVAVAAWAKSGHAADVVEFIDEVAMAMRESHLVISRAGAITLAELAAVGRGAVLVPLAAAGAHQLANARERERLGAARLVEGGDGLVERLAATVRELLADRERLAVLAANAAKLGRPEAAAQIADRLLDVASGRAA